jgi:hypothetical protein
LIRLAQFEGGGNKNVNLPVRLTGINALATFGPDAKLALPALKKMNLDPSEKVRDAARDAITAIEKESLEKPADKVAEKPVEKDGDTLFVKDLIARELAMKIELAKVTQAGNQNLVQQTIQMHDKERAAWLGKPVKGVGEVTEVSGIEVTLFTDDSYPGKGGKPMQRIRFIHANAKAKDDPLLTTLKRGNVVEFVGVMDKSGRPRDGPFTVNDCVFTLKK